MDRNRKILIAILAVVAFSAVLAIVDISLTMQERQTMAPSIGIPQVGPGVGVVRIEGPIDFSDSSSPFGMLSGAEAAIKRLDEMSRNPNIRAIVLRINSPGGTVGATQEIYQKLMNLRKRNVVVVASMGEIAASGGYYIASACSRIVANYGTITGSIGVIIMAPNLRQLFDKLGINMAVIKSGKYKDILSSFREMTPEERELIQEIIDSSYQKFVSDVSLGRNLSRDDILPVADGRIMTGNKALECKLVDVIGTFEDAVNEARKLAKLPEDSAVYDEVKSPFQQLLFSMEGMYRGRSAGLLERSFGFGGYNIVQYRYQP
ncbi:MAG: signal peptide peptidase SppA [Spirochaetes bacterium]|nr:signal peptide peptidase SppA [Spirochaetota bacterium]